MTIQSLPQFGAKIHYTKDGAREALTDAGFRRMKGNTNTYRYGSGADTVTVTLPTRGSGHAKINSQSSFAVYHALRQAGEQKRLMVMA